MRRTEEAVQLCLEVEEMPVHNEFVALQRLAVSV